MKNFFSKISVGLATNVENFQFAISAFKRTSPRVFLTPGYFFMIVFTIFGLSWKIPEKNELVL